MNFGNVLWICEKHTITWLQLAIQWNMKWIVQYATKFLHGLGEAMEYTNTTNLGMHNGMRFYIRFSENWCEMSTYSTRLFNLRSIGNYLRYLFLMYAIWSRCQVSCVWKSIPFQALAKHAYVLETNTSNQKSPQFPFVFRKIA